MRNILAIYKADLKNIATNWVVAVIVGGLIILPSLYAWFNIKASWDPYGQTNQIPVGIVNEDAGTVIREKSINVGDNLVERLKENNDFNWQFVDRKKAMKEVEYGNYYAVIVVPENFSETLGTVVSANPEKATMEYFVNEKVNAIAPKITDKGASVIIEQISSNFIATVNGAIFEMFNQIGIELETELPDIEKFENYVFKLEKELPNIHALLLSSDSDVKEAQKILGKTEQLLPEVTSVTNNGLQTIDQTLLFLTEAEERLENLAPKIIEDLKQAQSILHHMNDIIQNVERNDHSLSEQKKAINQLKGQLDDSLTSLIQIKNILQQMEESLVEDNEQIKLATTNIHTLEKALETLQIEVNKLSK